MKMRERVLLRPRFEEELNEYVDAAKASASTKNLATAAVIGAVGMGSLSLVPVLHGEVVYTPVDESVGRSLFDQAVFSTLKVDLNNDGIPDFVLSAYNLESFSSAVRLAHSLFVTGLQSNNVLAKDDLALALAPGQVIGLTASARARFTVEGLMATDRTSVGFSGTFHASTGLWLNATNRYLGIKFLINDETHYGWARLTAHAGFANLTGYAYETVADKPIRAGALDSVHAENNAIPAPAGSLGELAMGVIRPRRGD